MRTTKNSSSVHFKMAYMRSEKPICAPPRLSEVSPTLPFKRFQCSSDWRWPSLILSRKIFPGISPFHTSLRQAIGGVMSLALCRQVVSQASQHFRSSEKQATCEGCFARQSIYSVISRTLATVRLSGHRKTLHTAVRLGSAAPAAALPLPSQDDPLFPPRD